MAPDDCLRVDLPPEFLDGSVSQLLEGVFPPDADAQQGIEARFDLRANPDLPEIYAVFLAVCEEWRDWRCALAVSAAGVPVELDEPVSSLAGSDGDGHSVTLRLEQLYGPLEYALRHGLWSSRDELLDWMRSLMALYFLDKHEVELAGPGTSAGMGPCLAKALEHLQSEGFIGLQEQGEDSPDQPGLPGLTGRFAITPEGRQFIDRLLGETETYIDLYDHYQDTLVDVDRDVAEFGTGQGADLRVQVFLVEGLDPIRTVFLLRLYDGTLDARLRDWAEVLESTDFFEAVLEPVANRDGVAPEAVELVLEHGHAWLEEQQEQARRKAADRELLRRAGGDVS